MKFDLPLKIDSWFYVCPSHELEVGEKHLFDYLEERILIYRNQNKEVVAVHRNCPHMNADLNLGEVSNNQLKCALHLWCFDQKGKIKNGKKDLKIFPVKELYGHIFIYIGKDKNFSLPFFPELTNKNIISSSPKVIKLQNKWFIGPANAFDLSHFINVHKRKLINRPELIEIDQHGVMLDIDFEILGNSFSDRLMKTLYGKLGGLNFKVFSGNFILATTRVKNFKNYMMIVNQPINENQSIAYLIIFAEKKNNIFQKLKIAIQAALSQKFFQDEADSFYGITINEETLDENDWMLRKYISWLKNYFTHQ